MAFFREHEGLDLAGFIALYQTPCPDEEDPGTWYEEVGYYIGTFGNEGSAFLLNEAERADEHRLRGVLVGLSTASPSDPAVRQLLRAHLEYGSPMVVQAAIDGLAHIRDVDTLDRVRRLLDHDSEYVVGAALRYLARLVPDDARPILLGALTDPRYIVRENAVDELDELADPGGPDVVAQIAPLLDDPHPHVRQAARTFFEHWGTDSA